MQLRVGWGLRRGSGWSLRPLSGICTTTGEKTSRIRNTTPWDQKFGGFWRCTWALTGLAALRGDLGKVWKSLRLLRVLPSGSLAPKAQTSEITPGSEISDPGSCRNTHRGMGPNLASTRTLVTLKHTNFQRNPSRTEEARLRGHFARKNLVIRLLTSDL